ncbi:MAG: spermidine synthase [Thermoplasmata archaeon]
MDECRWTWKRFLGRYYLKCNDRVFSVIDPRRIYTGSYWDVFLPFISFFKDPKVLIIGLGGGTTIFQVRSLFKDVHIEAVDIDKRSMEMASKFLDMNKEIVHIIDGKDFVISCNDRFHVVILDAYDRYGIPEHFLKEDFVCSVKNILYPDGFFITNYALTLQDRLKLKNFIETLRRNFKVYRVGPTIIENNMVIVASSHDKEEIVKKIHENNIFPRKLVKKIINMRENI